MLSMTVICGNHHRQNKERRKTSVKNLPIRKIYLPLQPGKSYTACSLGIPPGLDRSKGTWL